MTLPRQGSDGQAHTPEIRSVSETSFILTLGDEIDLALPPLIGRISSRIQNECSAVCEVTPSYTTILIEANILNVDMEQLQNDLLNIAQEECLSDREVSQSGKLIELPVYYHPEVGPDLEELAEKCQLSVEEVIKIHSGRDYTVCAIGFAPGFAFLADVDERIRMPRHDSPRAKVSAGSVGIAGRQTAVYPDDTPGGWQIIGNCPLFALGADVESLFQVGDQVRFTPIDRAKYLERGGHV